MYMAHWNYHWQSNRADNNWVWFGAISRQRWWLPFWWIKCLRRSGQSITTTNSSMSEENNSDCCNNARKYHACNFLQWWFNPRKRVWCSLYKAGWRKVYLCIKTKFSLLWIHIFFKQLIYDKIWFFTGCGGAFTAPSGNIHSPNYPNMYNHDDDCGYLITVDFGHVVQLTFLDFDLEHQTNCRYDNILKNSMFSQQ